MAVHAPNIEKLQAHSGDEWATLQRIYWRRIFFYARNYIPDHQDCEDVVQETFLGAVRGIENYDKRYNIEQYLFGIARNRVVDWLRRSKSATRPNVTGEDEEGAGMGMDLLAHDALTASQVMQRKEVAGKRRIVMGEVLRELVSELWERQEFKKLMILELIFVKGARNKDIWERFGLQDEKAVAGIKFRSIQRLKELAKARDPDKTLFPGLWRNPYE